MCMIRIIRELMRAECRKPSHDPQGTLAEADHNALCPPLPPSPLNIGDYHACDLLCGREERAHDRHP